MTRRRSLWVVAVAVLLATALGGGMWAFARNGGGPWQNGPMGGTSIGIAGTGRVTTLEQAGAAARRYADTLDLKVGEVMQFRENFYAELLTASGSKATEVLIEPATGEVRIEYGPAMMWNTAYGMHSYGMHSYGMRSYGMPNGDSQTPVRVTPEQARQIADRWLGQHQRGTASGEPDVFPGYYTLHSLKDGAITGMLSVNASTGAVWYHSWHGDFVAMTES